MKTSLEVEYWVVDADGNLASADGLVESPRERERGQERERRRSAADEGAPRVTVTTPLESPPDLAATFAAELEAVRSRAADRERRLVPLGTTINAADDAVGESSERDRIRRAVAGRDTCGNRCAGARVRIDPGRETGRAVDRLNALVALEPALALVNSAPYVRGERLASGARTYCRRTAFYDAWSPDGPGRERNRKRRRGRPWGYVDGLEEWRERLEGWGDSLAATAMSNGVDERTLAAYSPADLLPSPIRLRDGTGPLPLPLLEWRAPDTALPSQLLRLVRDLEDAVTRVDRAEVRTRGGREITDGDGRGFAGDERIALPDSGTLADLADAAVRDGLANRGVADYLEWAGFSVDDYHPISRRIDGRQYATAGDARELRLEYATRLEEDLAALSESVGD